MSNSILKEVTFTPQLLDKKYNLEDILNRFSKLRDFLSGIGFSGIVIGLSRENWQDQINKIIDTYDDSYSDLLRSLFNNLLDRNKIVYYPGRVNSSLSEDEWISISNKLNSFRKFDLILATKNTNIIKNIESLQNEDYHNEGGIVEKQTLKSIKKMLAPALSYSEIVKIIDPYFSFDPVSGKKDRYRKTIEMVCEILYNNHSIKNKGFIEIHTSVKSMLNNDKEFVWQFAKKWPKIISLLEEKYDHKIILNIWEEIKREDEWHERWIISDQCGISVGKGSDISDWTESTWGLLKHSSIAEIESKFNPNRGVYTFIGSVTSKGVQKNTKPKNHTLYLSEEERNIKRNNPVSIKERMAQLKQKKEN